MSLRDELTATIDQNRGMDEVFVLDQYLMPIIERHLAQACAERCARLELELYEAALEINCPGSIVSRIRVLKGEHCKRLIEAELRGLKFAKCAAEEECTGELSEVMKEVLDERIVELEAKLKERK